jgi:hypothetical protein
VGEGVERQEVDLTEAGQRLHNGRCFILANLLTPLECANLIAAAEHAASKDAEAGGGGWEKLGRMFASEYRDGDRLLVMDEPLAHALWLRIKPSLTRDDVLRVRPIGSSHHTSPQQTLVLSSPPQHCVAHV